MKEPTKTQFLMSLIPAQRCPDFDSDCKDVKNKSLCFAGGEVLDKTTGRYITLDGSEGYCPYVIGQMKVK